MVFYRDDEMLIRNMQESDAQIITDCEILQGYHASVEKYRMRLRHQREGKSVALVAEYRGQVAGYMRKQGIQRLWILECFRSSGEKGLEIS